MAVRNLLVNLGLVVGKAAAKFDPSGIAAELLDQYGRHHERAQLRGELEDLLQLGFGRFREQLADAMGDLRLQLAESVRGQVEAYLSQFQASARQAARILGDPSATTVPATVGVDDPLQLAAFLPQQPPRFAVGNTVPGLPSWTLVEPLGSGGFGEVWKANNPYVGDTAFKFFLDPAARKRFTHAEAENLAEILRKAPTDGVVKLLGAEPGQDPPWLQFEYISGGDLSSLPESWKALPDQERVNRVRGVIRSLAATAGHFHNLGVVHRDLKPSNVLVRPNGALVIADFGISKLVPAGLSSVPTPTNSGTATIRAYTALYASPQQKKFKAADRRDDVYALGVLWYQLLRGDLTLERPSGEGWKRALAKIGVSDGEVALLNRCWDDEPDDRPSDGNQLARMLSGDTTPAVVVVDWVEDSPPKPPPVPVETQKPPSGRFEELAKEIANRERAERLERWKKSPLPRAWVMEHLDGWSEADWVAMLEELRRTSFWPLETQAMRDHLNTLQMQLAEEREKARKSAAEREAARRAEQEVRANQAVQREIARTGGPASQYVSNRATVTIFMIVAVFAALVAAAFLWFFLWSGIFTQSPHPRQVQALIDEREASAMAAHDPSLTLPAHPQLPIRSYRRY